jgi:tripartite-type tricarboxylate transporter receptor subunit TctC
MDKSHFSGIPKYGKGRRLGEDPWEDLSKWAFGLAERGSLDCVLQIVHSSRSRALLMPMINENCADGTIFCSDGWKAYVKANPDKVNYGSPGVGTVGHLSIELFATQAGIKINHIPYKGASQYQNDLIAGHIQLAQIQLAACIPLLKQGKIKTIGVTADKRSAVAPDIPTIAEQGMPGYQSYNWNGILAPAATPNAIITKLHSVLSKQLATKENQELFISQGYEPSNFTPEEFANFIHLETEKWAKVAKQADIKE